MATWRGNRPVEYVDDMGANYADCEKSWEYGTVSDILTIITKVGSYVDWTQTVRPSQKEELYGKEEALALLEILMDWANKYEGEHVVDEIVKRIRKG